ncbi:MAG: VCBS repeat-containing protein [Deltaproteobacteria bacterium]|nr:VCBS repeat-containing protein [Deltaproteobacteria bacterium]
MSARALLGAAAATTAGLIVLPFVGCDSGDETYPPLDRSEIYGDGTIVETAECAPAGGSGAVAAPVFVMNVNSNTGWYSSPAIFDLSDGTTTTRALVVPSYDIHVYSPSGELLSHVERGTDYDGRIYAPIPIGDLDNDGITDIALGAGDGTAAAYEWTASGFVLKAGWAGATTCSAGQCPETRGMAAADLDGDGTVEIAMTTTQTEDAGAQVFVFSADGQLYQPAGLTDFQAWPRYNTESGPGNDADFNGQGNHGYGCYGLNVGIGNIDDDPELEVIATYDNHHINAFNHDGTSLLASSYFTNRSNDYSGNRLGWGQFIRYADPEVEDQHYHLHEGDWPGPSSEMWLQWTASPPSVADLNGDGRNEVLGFPNGERHEPYETQAFLLMVLEGNHGDGERAARRLPGFEQLPSSDKPTVRESGDWYPPSGVPAPAIANLLGDAAPEIVVSLNDGLVYAFSPTGERLWRYDVSNGIPKVFSSEPVLADLNADGRPEVIFGTYALTKDAGKLVILDNTGVLLHELRLPDQGDNGNGIGVPAAPTVGDLDGDGQLEIVLLTFDHGADVFTVPGSQLNCTPWATARGNYLRNGQGPGYAE